MIMFIMLCGQKASEAPKVTGYILEDTSDQDPAPGITHRAHSASQSLFLCQQSFAEAAFSKENLVFQ